MAHFYGFYTCTNSPLSKAVMYRSYGTLQYKPHMVTHSGLILVPDKSLITPDSLVFESTYKHGGVRITTLKEVIKRTPRFIATEHNTPITDAQFRKAFDTACHLEGLPYDVKGILGLAADQDWQENDMFFCSEGKGYVMLTSDYTGVDWSEYDYHRIDPKDNFSWPQTIIKLPF